MSLSIKINGVEVVSSQQLDPIFSETQRSVELNFGLITARSVRQFITVMLPAQNFFKPILPDIREASITDKRRSKERYLALLNQYMKDSIQYFSERNHCIYQFKRSVDSILNIYKNIYSSRTDLITALRIADKIFNYSAVDGAENILIVNSDGQDSFHRNIRKLHNKARVILVNANAIQHTNLDAIVTNTFASPDAAIQFILNNNKNPQL
jgi:hypothetical protein